MQFKQSPDPFVCQAAFGFTSTTAAFKRLKKLKQSPRSFGTANHLNMVNLLEGGTETLANTLGSEGKEELMKRIQEASALGFAMGKTLAIHDQPLLPRAIEPVPASMLPASEQFLPLPPPPPVLAVEEGSRPGNLPTQAHIDSFFRPRRHM